MANVLSKLAHYPPTDSVRQNAIVFTIGIGFGALLAAGYRYWLQNHQHNTRGRYVWLPDTTKKCNWSYAGECFCRLDNYRCCLQCGRFNAFDIICGCGNDTVDHSGRASETNDQSVVTKSDLARALKCFCLKCGRFNAFDIICGCGGDTVDE